ncbi:predicted protein [Naegleria gruberi]|uniref:Predicted protein n=1 Tax=Naegleria gruberi TaxID=5762 RepID=D2UX20_NAEGR|nr:uncharacterized protein NAEGRDRAFT_61606 [Naegleria gruberi]EFC50546.1 predicted protein [Naegleria gruberi]|eukprot:XP_002683290.1 predicted protein [Naegleria gruberi strain NEG-M]
MFRQGLLSLSSSLKTVSGSSNLFARGFSKQLSGVVALNSSQSSLLQFTSSLNVQQTRCYAIPRKVRTKLWYEQQEKEKVDGKGRIKYARQQPEVNNTFILQQLSVLKKNRNWKRAYTIFKRISETKARPKAEVFQMLLYTIGYRGGQMKEAFEVFNYMKKCQKDVKSYNVMLHACSKYPVEMNTYIRDHDETTNSFNTAVKIYNEIKERKITSFTISYMAKCVESAVQQNLLDEAGKQEWIQTLQQDGEAFLQNPNVQKALTQAAQAVSTVVEKVEPVAEQKQQA